MQKFEVDYYKKEDGCCPVRCHWSQNNFDKWFCKENTKDTAK